MDLGQRGSWGKSLGGKKAGETAVGDVIYERRIKKIPPMKMLLDLILVQVNFIGVSYAEY